MEQAKQAGLALLRQPFPSNQISKLPKPYRKDSPKGKCPECGGYHGLPAVHLDYVGHAALTDRLLDCDPSWTWEPLACNAEGYPIIDGNGGMWIKLTVCGVTRLGYGDAQGKAGGDAMKERIGDALRNAAMRFGAALDLWHKGDLHIEDDDGNAASKRPAAPAKPAPTPEQTREKIEKAKAAIAPKPHAKGTISGDPAEGDLSGIGAEKPDPAGKPADEVIGNVIHAFASIGFTIEALEAEYGKRIDEWTNADVGEAREVFKIKKAEHASKSGAI